MKQGRIWNHVFKTPSDANRLVKASDFWNVDPTSHSICNEMLQISIITRFNLSTASSMLSIFNLIPDFLLFLCWAP